MSKDRIITELIEIGYYQVIAEIIANYNITDYDELLCVPASYYTSATIINNNLIYVDIFSDKVIDLDTKQETIFEHTKYSKRWFGYQKQLYCQIRNKIYRFHVDSLVDEFEAKITKLFNYYISDTYFYKLKIDDLKPINDITRYKIRVISIKELLEKKDKAVERRRYIGQSDDAQFVINNRKNIVYIEKLCNDYWHIIYHKNDLFYFCKVPLNKITKYKTNIRYIKPININDVIVYDFGYFIVKTIKDTCFIKPNSQDEYIKLKYPHIDYIEPISEDEFIISDGFRRYYLRFV